MPCTCLIAAGNYSVPDTLMDVTKKLPSQADDEFKLEINIGSTSGRVSCIELQSKLNN